VSFLLRIKLRKIAVFRIPSHPIEIINFKSSYNKYGIQNSAGKLDEHNYQSNNNLCLGEAINRQEQINQTLLNSNLDDQTKTMLNKQTKLLLEMLTPMQEGLLVALV
jgi:hypothetical protein